MEQHVNSGKKGGGDTSMSQPSTNSETSKTAVPALHVYVKWRSDEATKIFSAQESSNDIKWIYSGEAELSYDSKCVPVGNQLYCLNYDDAQSPSQTFFVSQSTLLNSRSSLKPPPLAVKWFELCAVNNRIYLYNRNAPYTDVNVANNAHSSEFSAEELSRGIYMYNCEVDKWVSLPPLALEVGDACMTCDDQNGLVYLIGGENTDETPAGYAQAYDYRLGKWMAITRSEGIYNSGTSCCFWKKNVCVTGDAEEPNRVELYDTVAGKWRYIRRMNESKTAPHLASCADNLWVFDENLSTKSSAEVCKYSDDGKSKWSNAPSLKTVLDSYSDNRIFVDSVVF